MVPFQLRLPDELHAELKASAAAHFRSLHAEVLSRLVSPVPRVAESHAEFRRRAVPMEPKIAEEFVQGLSRREVQPDPKVKPRKR